MTPYTLCVSIDCSTPTKAGTYSNKFPPSLNARLHWTLRAKLNKLWRARVFLSVDGISRPKYPLEKSQAIFTKFATRSCDFDNLVTSMKPIADGLKDAGVIVDDSTEHFTAQYNLKLVKRGQEKIQIEVKEVYAPDPIFDVFLP